MIIDDSFPPADADELLASPYQAPRPMPRGRYVIKDIEMLMRMTLARRLECSAFHGRLSPLPALVRRIDAQGNSGYAIASA